MSEKFVVTGPGCSGLTTTMSLIEEVAGIPTIPEAARAIIERGVFHPLVDPVAFRREQLRVQVEAERQYDGYEGVVALDRGIYCGTGFCYATGCAVPSFLRELPGRRYPLMFLLEQIPEEVRRRLDIQYHDGVRYEDPNSDEVLRLPNSLCRAYEEAGVDVVAVPFMSDAMERVRFILETVERRLGVSALCFRFVATGHVLSERPQQLLMQTS